MALHAISVFDMVYKGSEKLHPQSTIKCFRQVTGFILLISHHRLLC